MKQIFWGMLAVITILCIVPNAKAIQIGMPRDSLSIVFEPNLEKEYTYYVKNNRNIEVIAVPKMRGGLAQYVTFNVDKIRLKPEQAGEIKALLRLPKELAPGMHEVMLGAGEEIPNSGGISVQTTAQFRVEVRGRHSGKYAGAELGSKTNIREQKRYEKFFIAIQNLGEEDIDEVYGTIDIYDANDEAVGLIKTDKRPLKIDEKTTLESEIETTNLKRGVYEARGTVYYDGSDYRTNNITFRVGENLVKIVNYPKQGQAGVIQVFPIQVESEWNEEINNVYAKVVLTNESGVLSNLQTPSITLEGFGKGKLQGFIDLTNTTPNEYDVEIQVYYGNRITKVFDKYGVVVKLEVENPMQLSNAILITNILLILIIMLLIANFYRLKKQRAK